MPFWRSWAAAVLGASGAAVAVPVGLVLTVVVAAGVSGGGFGGLAQLTRGPDIPGVGGPGPRAASPLDGGLPALPSGRGTTLAASRGTGLATTSTARRAGRTTTTPATTGTRTPTVPATTPTTPTTTTPPTTATAAPPTTAGTTPVAPAPTSRPNPLREVVRTVVQGVVVTVPGVGKPVSDAVGSVADLLLPPLPPRSAPSP